MNKRVLHSHASTQEGSVLIVVMVICLGLVSLTLFFGHSMLMAYRGSETEIAGRQANRAIDGALQYAEYLMTVSGSSTSGYFLPTPNSYQSEAVPVGDAAFWFIGEPTATGVTDQPAFGLVDEASKLNLNTATLPMLENLPNMTQNLAESIIAWRTSGSTSTTANSGSGSSPTSKGGPFESIYELAQVCNFDGDDLSLLYGNDTNLNHIHDSSEDRNGTQYNPGLLEYVTVFSREPNTVSGSTQRVNVTVSGPSVSGSQGVTGISLSPALRTLLTGTFGETRTRQIEKNVGRSASPVSSVLDFYIRSGMTAIEFGEISPSLTMSSTKYARGLINVNTASAVVLACVPGITQEMASELVSTRQGQKTPPSNNLAWVVPILGSAAAIQAGPYLTAQTYQVSADVAAVGRNGRGFRRTLCVIDASTGTPQIVYRHNMAGYGWALGPGELQKLGQLKVKP